MKLKRRSFLGLAGALTLASVAGYFSLRSDRFSERYTQEEADALIAQKAREAAQSGSGPFGRQVYEGYRGLAALPWYELNAQGRLVLVDESVPAAVDVHAHLGMNMLFAPDLDLSAQTDRVEYMLDCDATAPGCPLDLDVYINANFSEAALRRLQLMSLAQILHGSSAAATHTIPNLLAEMDDCRVEKAQILPIAWGLPFGDALTENWFQAIESAKAETRLLRGGSVVPGDPEAPAKLRALAAEGIRMIKLHPTMQRFYPDDPAMAPIYETCGELGLPILYHGGRAGIEPEFSHKYALMRHYEGAIRDFPNVQFVMGHAGARDVDQVIPLAQKYANLSLGIHGQGVTKLDQLVREVGSDKLLYGTDWPFYHLAATQAKVLMVTEGKPEARYAILRGNAERLFGFS
ncbi:amidohydrolase family protein [Parvibaculaceae bacterium PLY_AMNH_Bact1]|nr:amidohydrolase family protein [Parvibaculaceae bacterium PLY_AMNH_Bact1]